MKLKSLLLGSAAVVALSTGAQAADPTFSLVSLNVCDAYGITGLTIASDDTCLRISGSVSYQFRWGDYSPEVNGFSVRNLGGEGAGALGGAGTTANLIDNDGTNDWRSRLEAILRFEATTQTEAGPATATLVFRQRDRVARQGAPANVALAETSAHALRLQEAWVSFGDTTVLMAGRKGSIKRLGDDTPFNFLGLIRSDALADNGDEEGGVYWRVNGLGTGNGYHIQVESEIADGIKIGAGLENLGATGTAAAPPAPAIPGTNGTFVGFVEASGAWGSAHATILANQILSNLPGVWAAHLGGTFNFDNFRVRGALAFDDSNFWNGMISGEATFDMFTLAASAEFTSDNQFGAGASAGFQATDDIGINLGFRYFDDETTIANNENWEAAIQVVAAMTDTISATGTVGIRADAGKAAPADSVAYLDLGVTYNPGGGFRTGGNIEVTALGGYRLNFNASKSF